MPVCWRCLRWGWRLHMRHRQRRRRCRSSHSRTAVWRENDNDVVISTAKKTGVAGYCLQPPSAAHYYQARITKNYTIKHYRVDYYEYGVKKRTFYQDMYEQVSEDPYLVCVS